MSRRPTIRTRCLYAEVVTGDRAWRWAVQARLRWEPDHPYTVSLTLQESHTPTTWLLSRELLADGLTRAAGLGQVSIWPGTRDRVVVRLASPTGLIACAMVRPPVERFLADTAGLVPIGTEADHIDWATELAALTGNADA